VTETYEVVDQPLGPVPAAPPRKKYVGLVIAAVIVGLLLLCGCCIGAYFIYAAATSDSSASTPARPVVKARETKAEITAAFAFVKGMGSGDIELFKTVMPAETVKTVAKETWDSLLGDAAADPTEFGTLAWSGDTAAVDFSAGDGSKGTMDFHTTGTDLVIVTLKPEASESEEATLTVVKEDGRWTVSTFETVDGVLGFDPESVKAIGQ
jgi:outer membrane murein-binding lipoprotein Lpp